MTDSSGNEVNRYDYDPYGQMLNQQEQSGLNNPWKFAAGSLDSSTGLTKFGVRYDDPSVGRWTQQDPIGGSLFDPRSSNRYVYARCNPVNAVDPSGKGWWDCFWAGFDTAVAMFGILVAVAALFGAAALGAIAFFVVAGGIVFAYIQGLRTVYSYYQACFG